MRILDNGVYRVGKRGAREIALLGSGVFGGATVNIGYVTIYKDDGSFKPIPEEDAIATDDFSVTFSKGAGTYAAVSVVGGSGIDIEIVDNSI
jgi:hypothetical protein